MKFFKSKLDIFLTVILFIIVIFLSTYKLTESPPTWMDEGIIIQTARSILSIGHPAIPIAPNTYESSGMITTSYPVTLPIAFVFKLFGIGLFQARLVMVIYLLLFFIFSFFILKRFISSEKYIISFIFILSFAPIYGHGKNVLGEVPGMLFFIVLLLILYFHSVSNKSKWLPVLAGLSSGLFVVTKPIFILLIPAMFVAFIINKYWLRDDYFLFLDRKSFLKFSVALMVPIILWFIIQFSGDSLISILSLYANPYKVNLFPTILNNIKILFSNAQPIYFSFLFFIWLITFVIRLYRRSSIHFAESISFIFSFLVFLAFFRTFGYYRYFFPAQIMALIYFIPNLDFLFSIKSFIPFNLKTVIKSMIIISIYLLQFYGLFFTSWVAHSYQSTKTGDMSLYFSKIHSNNIFLYQAPEVATFLPIESFYQFFFTAPEIAIGRKSLIMLTSGIPDIVITNSDILSKNKEIFLKYPKKIEIDRYSILSK